MVPPDSHRISRVPRYSGYCYASDGFVYGAIARYGMLFQTFPLTIFLAISQSYNPNNAGTSLVWALPRSLATTWGIIRLFSLPTGTKMFQFPAFAHYIRSVSNLQLDGLSHSEILGSKVICTSPRLFAAYHVLHRLQEPRHPPYALLILHRLGSLLDFCQKVKRKYLKLYFCLPLFSFLEIQNRNLHC